MRIQHERRRNIIVGPEIVGVRGERVGSLFEFSSYLQAVVFLSFFRSAEVKVKQYPNNFSNY